MMKFESYPEIGEKIFSYLDLQTLLSCQNVCQDWKQVLENPYFWLKKLKDVGQSKEIENSWKNLIAKSTDFGVAKSDFAECLQKKFKDFILAQNKDKYFKEKSIFYLNCPPLFTAAHYGHIEIVKLIYDFGEDFNRKIYWNQTIYYCGRNYFEMPIFVAIQKGHIEVVKFLIDTPQELENPSIDYFKNTPAHVAIMCCHFELVKYLAPRTNNLNHKNFNGKTLIHLAIRDIRIFKYLMSIPSIDPNLMDNTGETPLHSLCDKYMKITVCKRPIEDIIEMVKILAPITDKIYDGTKTPLHIAASYGFMEVLEILVEFLDANFENPIELLPIDLAILENHVEAVRLLAPYTKELKISDRFKPTKYPPSSALIEMKSLIEDRKKCSMA